MSRPKGEVERRFIIDLSYPENMSVNDGVNSQCYLGAPFKLRLPSPESLRQEIVKCGSQAWLWSIDLARGFRQLRIDPRDWGFLLLRSKQHGTVVDTGMPFGWVWGAALMHKTTEVPAKILQSEGYTAIPYVDDQAGVQKDKETATAAFQRAQTLLRELGLQEASHKAQPPTQKMKWLGIVFDTVNMEMSIPGEKIQETLALVEQWLRQPRGTKQKFQRLLGKLFYVANTVHTLRLFCNRLLACYRDLGARRHVEVDAEGRKDLLWCKEFLPQCNGRAMITPTPTLSETLDVDACLSGAGAVLGSRAYKLCWPQGIRDEDMPIHQLEMLNLYLAIRMWQDVLQDHVVTVRCDNAAAVAVVQSGRGRDLVLLDCARYVWAITAQRNIAVQVEHLAGEDNVLADALSRAHLGSPYQQRVETYCESGGNLYTVPVHWLREPPFYYGMC